MRIAGKLVGIFLWRRGGPEYMGKINPWNKDGNQRPTQPTFHTKSGYKLHVGDIGCFHTRDGQIVWMDKSS